MMWPTPGFVLSLAGTLSEEEIPKIEAKHIF
jgi:hypothetical protein